MSKSITTLFALSFVVLVGACAQQEEEVVFVEPEPIVEEPTYNKF